MKERRGYGRNARNEEDKPAGRGGSYGAGTPAKGGRRQGAYEGSGWKGRSTSSARRDMKTGVGSDSFLLPEESGRYGIKKAAGYKDSYGSAEDTVIDIREDLDRVEGRNPVIEALKSGRSINRIFVAKGEREGSINQIIAMARQKHIIIQEVDRTKLDNMSLSNSHQGVIALTATKDYVEVEDILESAAESGRPPFIIILDEITDSHNLGSILRTANAVGAHGVIIPKRRAVGLTAVVSKASAGAVEYVPVARVTNIVQTIEKLKKENIWVAGTDATGDKAYFESDLTGPIALVIGSEGEGMGKLVRESCDFIVNIPMMGQISSLNASVAAAVVMYEIFRQRIGKGQL